jgi:hypothetical protein
MKLDNFEETVETALRIFRAEYRDSFPIGGDASDHDAAERAGIEAVLIAIPVRCRVCGEWT